MDSSQNDVLRTLVLVLALGTLHALNIRDGSGNCPSRNIGYQTGPSIRVCLEIFGERGNELHFWALRYPYDDVNSHAKDD